MSGVESRWPARNERASLWELRLSRTWPQYRTQLRRSQLHVFEAVSCSFERVACLPMFELAAGHSIPPPRHPSNPLAATSSCRHR
jgi:hypothetical protein